jgi:hypothetical protein
MAENKAKEQKEVFKEFVKLKTGEGMKYSDIAKLFNAENFENLKKEYPAFLGGFEWFMSGDWFPVEAKRAKKIDNVKTEIKNDSKKQVEKEPTNIHITDSTGKTLILKPSVPSITQDPSKLEKNENVVYVDVNLLSELGKQIYSQAQGNVDVKKSHRTFIASLMSTNEENLKSIFSKLVTKVNNGLKSNLRDEILLDRINAFSTFFNTIKNCNWATSLIPESTALGQVIASEVGGREGKILSAYNSSQNVPELNDEEMKLLDDYNEPKV